MTTSAITSIRENLNIRPTEQDKGLILDLEVRAYDNGIIQINGRPVQNDPANPATAWLEASSLIAMSLSEFQRESFKRRQS